MKNIDAVHVQYKYYVHVQDSGSKVVAYSFIADMMYVKVSELVVGKSVLTYEDNCFHFLPLDFAPANGSSDGFSLFFRGQCKKFSGHKG